MVTVYQTPHDYLLLCATAPLFILFFAQILISRFASTPIPLLKRHYHVVGVLSAIMLLIRTPDTVGEDLPFTDGISRHHLYTSQALMFIRRAHVYFYDYAISLFIFYNWAALHRHMRQAIPPILKHLLFAVFTAMAITLLILDICLLALKPEERYAPKLIANIVVLVSLAFFSTCQLICYMQLRRSIHTYLVERKRTIFAQQVADHSRMNRTPPATHTNGTSFSHHSGGTTGVAVGVMPTASPTPFRPPGSFSKPSDTVGALKLPPTSSQLKGTPSFGARTTGMGIALPENTLDAFAPFTPYPGTQAPPSPNAIIGSSTIFVQPATSDAMPPVQALTLLRQSSSQATSSWIDDPFGGGAEQSSASVPGNTAATTMTQSTLVSAPSDASRRSDTHLSPGSIGRSLFTSSAHTHRHHSSQGSQSAFGLVNSTGVPKPSPATTNVPGKDGAQEASQKEEISPLHAQVQATLLQAASTPGTPLSTSPQDRTRQILNVPVLDGTTSNNTSPTERSRQLAVPESTTTVTSTSPTERCRQLTLPLPPGANSSSASPSLNPAESLPRSPHSLNGSSREQLAGASSNTTARPSPSPTNAPHPLVHRLSNGQNFIATAGTPHHHPSSSLGFHYKQSSIDFGGLGTFSNQLSFIHAGNIVGPTPSSPNRVPTKVRHVLGVTIAGGDSLNGTIPAGITASPGQVINRPLDARLMETAYLESRMKKIFLFFISTWLLQILAVAGLIASMVQASDDRLVGLNDSAPHSTKRSDGVTYDRIYDWYCVIVLLVLAWYSWIITGPTLKQCRRENWSWNFCANKQNERRSRGVHDSSGAGVGATGGINNTPQLTPGAGLGAGLPGSPHLHRRSHSFQLHGAQRDRMRAQMHAAMNAGGGGDNDVERSVIGSRLGTAGAAFNHPPPSPRPATFANDVPTVVGGGANATHLPLDSLAEDMPGLDRTETIEQAMLRRALSKERSSPVAQLPPTDPSTSEDEGPEPATAGPTASVDPGRRERSMRNLSVDVSHSRGGSLSDSSPTRSADSTPQGSPTIGSFLGLGRGRAGSTGESPPSPFAELPSFAIVPPSAEPLQPQQPLSNKSRLSGTGPIVHLSGSNPIRHSSRSPWFLPMASPPTVGSASDGSVRDAPNPSVAITVAKTPTSNTSSLPISQPISQPFDLGAQTRSKPATSDSRKPVSIHIKSSSVANAQLAPPDQQRLRITLRHSQ